ncbi:S-layer homology domain-containing protein [Flintibacter faecis]|uniref:S-layer homology domain-containing protein n=1 Tax=Flintibacter faecis TaxID=2763047 RepID=A0A8J6J366_9FIRM|nr:S-layer homology domain-containing protein [Flintibacter faecis]MBC5716750.1 S-layer homology domain-containing protein [Flintibacter faecis]
MSKWKKSLAMVLTAAMLLSVLPVSTWAAESEPEPEDEVVFNLGTMDVTVGTDQARAEEGQEPYDLFQADGSYTLELEPDAFFPYEVQFTHDGQTQQVWFMDPEDTVDVGGHTFGVFSESTDPNKLTQIGIWVGEDYIPAYPEEKTFTNDGPEAMPISGGLPLAKEVKNVDLNLSNKYLPSQLTKVQVSAVLSGIRHNGTSSDRVAWVRGYSSYGSDNFQILDQSGTMDLSDRYGSFHIDLLVGSALQLDKGNNTLYQVNVTVPETEMFQWDVLAGTESVKSSSYYNENSYGDIKTDGYYKVGLSPAAGSAESLKLKMDFSDQYEANGKTASVYQGLYETEEALENAQEITGQIWGTDAAGIDVKSEDQVELTVVLKSSDGTVAGILPQTVVLRVNSMSLYPAGILTAQEPYTDVGDSNKSSFWEDGREVFLLPVKTGYAAEDTYALMLVYKSGTTNYQGTCDHIQKAVQGLYSTLDQAANQPDLKEKLFIGSSQYGKFTADFSKGVNFTVFDIYGGVHQFCVRTTESTSQPTPDYREEKSPLSADTYFQADGIADSSHYYVMNHDNDSYYSNGYQTIFTTDDVDLSKIKLMFSTPSGYDYQNGQEIPSAKIYAGKIGSTGIQQESGVTENDFSNGPVQYVATAQNGKDLKNYWVTVVKTDSSATSGKLFVNGINGSQGAKRTVFLTQAYDYHHDIFLANVGGGNLTNLKVELTDAQNVQLDEFWTIGGERNNTLAPLSIKDSDEASDGIAKVRLVPERNADGSVKPGAVSGKLTITAEGQDSVVIELTGVAFQPEITSGGLPDGVKYVPYGQLIMTNNEYDWLSVAIKQTSGKLPEGMIFRENGELYGVPQTTGEYSFGISAEYAVNEKYTQDYNYTGDLIGDTNNRAHLYLSILDNTAENVEAQTDVQDGYALLDRVQDTTVYQSQVFRSKGEYGNFVDFWLDGVKLVEGQDYDSEEGSTKITIRAQTFQKAGSGSHTIAAEFRHGGKNDLNSPLKKTAQVYKANTSGGGSSGGGGGGSSSGTSKGFDAGVSQAPNGTITVTPKTAAKGKLVTVTVTPDAGYRLDKLTATGKNGDDLTLTDIGGGKYTFVMPTGGARVSGSFVKIIQAAEGQPFEDVPQGAWFVDAVKYVQQNGLMAGTSATTFSPYGNTSRGMIVTILHGMCGKPVFEGCVFSDVEEGTYYAKATCWASQNQIISGFGQGEFGPDEDVQRDQLAVIMMRYAQYLGLETPERADLSGFVDADQISAYAQEAMSWASAVGLLSGKGDGIMDPQGVATRAEVAAMMARLDQMVKQTEG